MEPSEITSPTAAAVIPGRMTTPYIDNMTPVGSFYGRRDFENRQDSDDAISSSVGGGNLKRQPSMVGAVLERIKSKKTTKASDSSDTDLDDDDEEEDSD